MKNFYFTKEEMISFLTKRGYNVVPMRSFDIRSCYHNDVETVYYDELGAIKHGTTPVHFDEDHEMRKSEFDSHYALERVFVNELKSTLLAL